MQHIKKLLKFSSAAGIALLTTADVRGAAFDLPDQDAFAIGRGMAVVATANNPSAIYYNPAGISQLQGNNLRAGVYGISLEPSYTPPGGGSKFNNEDKLHAVPQFYYTYGRTNWPVSFGLGVYSPFGLGVEWPQNTGFRSVATQGKVTSATINPVIAIKLSPTLSLGGGAMVNYVNIDLQQGIYPYPASDLFRFKGDGWDVGYNLGLLWQPWEKLSFGTTLRSSTTVNLNGHTETIFPSGASPYNSPASSSWSLPLEAVFGVSYRPTPKWNLEFDADYSDWSELGTININQSSPPGSIPQTLDWESSWYFEWGATRYFDNGWHASAGFIFNENSVPDAHYSPLVADLNRYFFSVGVGHKGKSLDFDIAYQLGYGPDRTVSGSATPPGFPSGYHPADGTYSFFSQAIAVSAGWHF